MEQVQQIYKESKSPEDFFKKIEKSRIDTYERNGKITGVRSENGRKFRLKTIGFHSEGIAVLDQTYRKLKQLKETRRQKDIQQQKNKDYEINN